MKTRDIVCIFSIQILLLLLAGNCSVKKTENKLSRSAPENMYQALPLSQLYYSCPQHPQIRQYNPGLCSICRSDLIKSGALVQETERMESDLYPISKTFQPVYIPLKNATVVADSAIEMNTFSTLVNLTKEESTIFKSSQVVRLVDQENGTELLAYLEYLDKYPKEIRTVRLSFILSNDSFSRKITTLRIKAYKEGFWIPKNGLQFENGIPSVLLYRNKTTEITEVQTGIESEHFVEITEGIHPGDTLLLFNDF